MTSILCPQLQEKIGPGEVKVFSGALEELSDTDHNGTPSPPQESKGGLRTPQNDREIPRPGFAAAQLFVVQQLLGVPPDLELRKSSAPSRLGVWVKQFQHKGMKYGPYSPKYADKCSFDLWENASSRERDHIRQNWWEHIQLAGPHTRGNIRSIRTGDQITFEAIRDIDCDEELLLVNRNNGIYDSPESLDQQSKSSDRSEHSTESNDKNLDLDDEISRNQCLHCDKTFPDHEELDRHLIHTHGLPAGQYRCEHCCKSFSWKPNLIQHKTIHGDYKRYSCENCTEVFTDAVIFQKHIRAQHQGARSHACRECGKTFGSSSGLKQHTHIHSSVKPFTCEVCYKSYTQFSNLCRHKRMHENCRKLIRCNKCDHTFNSTTSLTKHKKFCDTAPTSGIIPTHAMPEAKLHQSPLGPGRLPSAATSSLMMCPPPPPFPFMAQSLLSSYPGFSSFPSLVPTPQQPLLSPSFFLPFHGVPSPLRDPPSVFSELQKDRMNIPLKTSPRPESPYEKFSLVDHIRNKQESPSPSTSIAPLSPKLKTEIKTEVPSAEEEEQDAQKKEENSAEAIPKKTKDGKETPLDLTTRKRELPLLPEDSEPDSTETMEEPSPKRICYTAPEEIKRPEPKKRTEHSLFSISDLLKDTTSSRDTQVVDPPVERPQSPSRPLAYPRPLHPNAFLEACRNFDKTFERNGFLSPPTNRYSLMSSLLPPNSMSAMGLGIAQPNRLDMVKALSSIRNQPYGADPCRPYDILSDHLQRAKDKYSCKFCRKVFPRSANLTRHLRTHTGEQPYQCKYCERSFSISSNLQRHVRNIHNKEKPFKCHLCERCFGQQTNLERHLKKHDEGGDTSESPEMPNSGSIGNDIPLSDEIRSFVDKVTNPVGEDLEVEFESSSHRNSSLEDIESQRMDFMSVNIQD